MPEDVRQKIFEPFFSTKGAHGTGLGLSVSYSIIERHEGSISVTTEPGKGSVFAIDLPAAEVESGLPEVLIDNNATPTLNILIVDDEPAVRETLAEMLEAGSHRVLLAEGGQDALQKLRSNSVDLVFTDLAMPEMDGWETAREIRKRWPEIKIVLVTGYGPTTIPPVGEEDLVDGIIGKPFAFAQVAAILSSLSVRKNELQDVGA
jgi:CheY-like chemotaxis protein